PELVAKKLKVKKRHCAKICHSTFRRAPIPVARLVARLAKLGYQVDLKRLDETSAHGPPPFEILPTPDKVDAPADAIKPTPRKRGRPCKCLERGILCKHGTSA